MPINLDVTIAFDNPETKRFLGDDSQQEKRIAPTTTPGFTYDAADHRPSLDPLTGNQASQSEAVGFLMRETYRVVAQGIPTTTQFAVVAYETDLAVTVDFWLGFRAGLGPEQLAHGRQLLASYDPLHDGADLSSWIEANLAGILTLDDFDLVPAIVLTKLGIAREVDARQRDALFGMFGAQVATETWAVVDVIDEDMRLRRWATDHGAQLVLTSKAVLIDDSGPVQDPGNCREVADAHDENLLAAALDDVLSPVWDQGCGVMEVKQFKLLTVGGWPEFKLLWVPRRIKVGCCRITIMVPQLQTRTCLLVFYVYYSVPANIGRTILKILETCAVRSALTSAVIGALTSNIAAAVASFMPLFKRCIESEIQKCVDPGIMLLKQRDNWH